MFPLPPREFVALRLQFATSNKKRGGRRSLPSPFNSSGHHVVSQGLVFVTFGAFIRHSQRRLLPLRSSNASPFAKTRTNTATVNSPSKSSRGPHRIPNHDSAPPERHPRYPFPHALQLAAEPLQHSSY